jgi:predicted deacetylase
MLLSVNIGERNVMSFLEMRQHHTKKTMAGITTTKQSGWSLDLLVASGWILATASIGILFDNNLALANHGFGKTAVMSILIGVFCWLGGGLKRR